LRCSSRVIYLPKSSQIFGASRKHPLIPLSPIRTTNQKWRGAGFQKITGKFKISHKDSAPACVRLEGLMKTHNWTEMEIEFEKMKQNNICDKAGYIIMIEVYRRQRKLDNILAVLDQMWMSGFNPEIELYHKLHLSFARDPLKLLHLFDQAKKRGIKPDLIFYNTIINALAMEHQIEHISHYLGLMEQEGIKPNIITYNPILISLVRKEKIDKLPHWLTRMQQEGIKFNTVAYNTLINGYAKIERYSDLKRVFEEMKKEGIPFPDFVTSALIQKAEAS